MCGADSLKIAAFKYCGYLYPDNFKVGYYTELGLFLTTNALSAEPIWLTKRILLVYLSTI